MSIFISEVTSHKFPINKWGTLFWWRNVSHFKTTNLLKWICRSNHRRCSIIKVLLKIFQYWHEKTCVVASQKESCRPEDLQCCEKETPTQLLSCEYWEIFKNTYFEKYLRTAASGFALSIKYLSETFFVVFLNPFWHLLFKIFLFSTMYYNKNYMHSLIFRSKHAETSSVM